MKQTTVKVTIPETLFKRVERAAEIRCIDVPTFIMTMLAWHCPASDNEAQYIKKKIKEVVAGLVEPVDFADAVQRIEELAK